MKWVRKGLVIGMLIAMLLAASGMYSFSLPGQAKAQASYNYKLVGKECGRCGSAVPLSSQVGQRCPYYGAYWGREEDVYIGGYSLPPYVQPYNPPAQLQPYSPQPIQTVSTGEIFGRVVNQAGQMILGTCIRINNTLMPTNAAGEFRFTLVHPGVYIIYYDAPGYVGQTRAIEVKAGQTSTPPTVVMSSGFQPQQSSYFGEIRGQLVDSSYRPIASRQDKDL